MSHSVKEEFQKYLRDLQTRIVEAVQVADGEGRFREDKWDRPEGGGGISKVLTGGKVFQKAGVNTSAVHGLLPQSMRDAFGVNGRNFFASGLSLVFHPHNPFVPTVHANWRYFELYDDNNEVIDSWFGGGTDLTPYYIFEEDGKHFHQTLKKTMDGFNLNFYPMFKKQCDEYFINKHRGDEARGIGGVFYDYLRPSTTEESEMLLNFQRANGNTFLEAYIPIVDKRKSTTFEEKHVHWQEIRRGRYAEFNLVHDRGTLFGLRTNGRIESILMSMPPRARWEYDYHPAPGSPEELLLEYIKPRDWIN